MTTSRRDMLALIAATSVLAACSKTNTPTEAARSSASSGLSQTHSATPSHVPTSPSTAVRPPQVFHTAPIPRYPVTSIPEAGNQIALTIDDGVRPDVIEGYVQLCKRTGMRLTFFANGQYDSWQTNRDLLAPLVESGQIVIGNHTLNHPDIRSPRVDLKQQVLGNEKVFHDLFGSQFSMKPYFRPPYGFYNQRRLNELHSMGYECVTMWMGTTGDEYTIPSRTIMKNLQTWSAPGRIIIGHANHPGVLKDFDAIHELFESRKLNTVTIADVYQRQSH